MTNIQEKIENHLNEKVDDVGDEVKGIKKFLDDFEDAYNYDNLKLSKKILGNIESEVKKIKKSI